MFNAMQMNECMPVYNMSADNLLWDLAVMQW